MWVSRQGGTGESPTPEQVEQWRRRTSAPDNEFPASVGLSVLLARTDDAAVGITRIDAFSTGFQFTLAVRLRQARPGPARGGLSMLVSAHTPPGFDIPLDDRLLLGIEYPDGRRASNLSRRPMLGPPGAVDDDQLMLVPQHGSGGEQNLDQTYWVAPLPPGAPITIILAWPGFGMPESQTVLDGAAVRAAAARSQLLWPPQPARQPGQLPPPPRPSSGWFAEPPDPGTQFD